MSSAHWNALLEALHSCLIDELNERFPAQKPVLHVPVRKAGFDLPAEGISGFMACSVKLGPEAKGVALIAVEPGLGNGGGLGAQPEESLWSGLLKRAASEFTRRELEPVFGSPRVTRIFPEELSAPRMVIWIPLGLERGKVFLGVGI